MPQRLDLRYRTSAEKDNDRANAIFSGAVLVYENRKSKFSIAYNLSVLNDFSSSFNLSGKNSNGIDSYFLHYADGIPYLSLIHI